MMKIKGMCFVAVAIMLVLLPAGMVYSAKANPIVFKVGHVLAASNPIHDAVVAFKKGVESRTDGQIIIELYPSSQLGDTKDILAQTMAGANVITAIDAAQLNDVSKPIQVTMAPYVFDTYDEIQKVTNSALFAKWVSDIEAQGIVLLTFNHWQGARHFYTNKEIKTIDDLKGLKIRVASSPTYAEPIKAMGAAATAVPWGEAYAAIQQKLVDGAEAQIVAAYGSKFHEVTKYLTKTGHIQQVSGLAIGKKAFENLPANFQIIMIEEAVKSGVVCYEAVIAKERGFEDEMKAAGMVVNTIDLGPFKKAVEPVYGILGVVEEKKQVAEILAK